MINVPNSWAANKLLNSSSKPLRPSVVPGKVWWVLGPNCGDYQLLSNRLLRSLPDAVVVATCGIDARCNMAVVLPDEMPPTVPCVLAKSPHCDPSKDAMSYYYNVGRSIQTDGKCGPAVAVDIAVSCGAKRVRLAGCIPGFRKPRSSGDGHGGAWVDDVWVPPERLWEWADIVAAMKRANAKTNNNVYLAEPLNNDSCKNIGELIADDMSFLA